MEINGIISAISQKEGRYGVCINDTWFNSFGTCPVAKGDNVVIRYEIKGDFKDIKQIGKRKAEPENLKKEKPLIVSPTDGGLRKSVKGSAYEKDPVGLAVEVFNAIYSSNQPTNERTNYMELMDASIMLVKQAQEAFK